MDLCMANSRQNGFCCSTGPRMKGEKSAEGPPALMLSIMSLGIRPLTPW